MHYSRLIRFAVAVLHDTRLTLQDLVQRTAAVKGARISKRSSDAIPKCEVLSIVARVQQVVVGVVSGYVNERLESVWNAEVAVVNRHGPNVDEHVQRQVQQLVHREHEDVEVIRDALEKTVNGVKGMTRIRRRHLPGMVRFVERGIDEPMVQAAMNPVDETVGEEYEEDGGHQLTGPACSNTVWHVARVNC